MLTPGSSFASTAARTGRSRRRGEGGGDLGDRPDEVPGPGAGALPSRASARQRTAKRWCSARSRDAREAAQVRRCFCRSSSSPSTRPRPVVKQLRQKPGMISTDVQMPAGLDLHPPTPRRWPFTPGRRRVRDQAICGRGCSYARSRIANVQTAPAARPGKDVTERCKCSAIRPRSAQSAAPASGSMRATLEPAGLRGKDLRRQRQQQQPAARRQRRTRRPLALDAATGAFPENPEYEWPTAGRRLPDPPDGLWIPAHAPGDCAQ